MGAGNDETSAKLWRMYLALEFATLFIAVPSLYIRFRHLVHPIPVIWCFAALTTYLLNRDGYFTSYRFWGERPNRKEILFLIVRFALAAVLIGLFTILYDPGRFLSFPRTKPALWLMLISFYPIFSAVPQGIIFRAFIFHRYEELFGKGWGMIAASGLVFCYAHIFYLNPVAVLLTLVGGIIFAHTYLKSGSLWLSSIEHALYGNFVFTIGLGYYIYSGVLR